MHIALIASEIDPEDSALRMLREEGYCISFIDIKEPNIMAMLTSIRPNLILYRDVSSDIKTDDFLKTLRNLSSDILYKCPFLFTFREPEKFHRHLYGLCSSSSLQEPLDPLLLLAKINAVLSSFEDPREDSILHNTRQFMEMQFCSTICYLEDMARIIRMSPHDSDIVKRCAGEISEGLDQVFYLTGALSFDGSEQILSSGKKSTEHPLPLQYSALHMIRDAIPADDTRIMRAVSMDSHLLDLIYIEYNRQELCHMFRSLIKEVVANAQSLHISAILEHDVTFRIQVRMTQGADAFHVSTDKLAYMQQQVKPYDGEIYPVIDVDGSMALCLHLPESAGVYHIATHDVTNDGR